jgi:DNA-binding transcriptional MerR regulator
MMEPKYVPIEDVAKHFSVSISTIRAWVRQEQIPQDTYIRVGNTYRFCIPDISEALTTKKKAPDINVSEEEVVVEAMPEPQVATDEDADLLELLDDDQ